MFKFMTFFGSICVSTLLANDGVKDLDIPLEILLPEGSINPLNRNHSQLFCPQHQDGSWSNETFKFNHLNRSLAAGKMQEFQNGFFKSTCFLDVIDYGRDEELCIFLHPTINYEKGMVIIASEEVLKKTFEDGLDLFTEAIDPQAIKVIKVPEKGGMGAAAAHRLQMGDPLLLQRPVLIFPVSDALWESHYGMKIRRQAIDHLPIHTRAAVARLHGIGETEDELVSDLIDKNVFLTSLSGDPHENYAALVLDASRFNHACRSNAYFHFDERTQILSVNALESSEPGAELTLSYRHPDMLRDERRGQLKAVYGFDCTCSHCQMSQEEGRLSDQRVQEIISLMSQDTHSFDEVHKLLDLCEIEKIPHCIAQANLILAMLYNWEGDMKMVKKYAIASNKLGLTLAGSSWSEYSQVDILLNTPEKHYSHFSKNKNHRLEIIRD